MRFAGFTIGASPAQGLIDQGNQLREAGRTADALNCFLRAIEADPSSYIAHNNAGLCHFELGDYARAYGSYTRALQHDARNPNVWGNRAAVQNALGNRPEAIADVTRAIELAPTDHDWWSLRGELFRLSGRYEEALGDLNRAATMAPHKPEYCYFLGRVLKLLSHWDAAIASYEQALRGGSALGDLTCDALNELGLCHLESGRPEQALHYIDAAIQLSPSGFNAIFNRGYICEQLNRWDEAIQAYSRALAVDGQSADALSYRANCHWKLCDYAAAAADYRAAANLDRQRVADRNSLGACLVELERYDEALAEFQSVIRQDRQNASAHRWIAGVHYRRKDYAAALPWYSKAIQLEPANVVTYLDRGDCLKALGQIAEAMAEWKKCLEIDPASFPALASLASLAAEQGANSPALEFLQARLASSPDDALTHLAMGNYYKAIKRFDLARRHCDAAIDLGAEGSGCFASRGELMYWLDDYRQAVADFTEAIRRGPLARFYMFRATSHWELGQLEAAVSDNTEALRIAAADPGVDVPVILYNRAISLRGLGRLKEAIADLDRAIELNPDDLDFFEARGRLHEKLGHREQALADTNRKRDALLAELREMQATGKVVRAAIIKAYSALWGPGSDTSGGVVLFSFDRHFADNPGELLALALRVGSYKGKASDDPDEQAVAVRMNDEHGTAERRFLVPEKLAGGRAVYISSVSFYRPFLKAGYITERIVPCLAEPGDQGRTRLLPHWAVKSKDVPATGTPPGQ
jgi:tetratricopeptide (TPR) repeat protein